MINCPTPPVKKKKKKRPASKDVGGRPEKQWHPNQPNGAQGLSKSIRGGHCLEVLKPTRTLETPQTPQCLL